MEFKDSASSSIVGINSSIDEMDLFGLVWCRSGFWVGLGGVGPVGADEGVDDVGKDPAECGWEVAVWVWIVCVLTKLGM